MSTLRLLAAATCAAAAGVCAQSASQPPSQSPLVYPEARRSDQIDTYHGVKVPDPYRWLENIDSAEATAWIKAEQELTRSYLDLIPGRERIRRHLTAVWNYAKWSPPERHGRSWVYTRNDGLQNQAVLYVTRDLDAEPRVLRDPNKLSSDGTVALKGTAFSDDGRYMAYGTSAAGSDWETWRVIDVTGKTRPADEIRWVKFSNTSWKKDGSGFFYNRYDAPSGTESLKDINEFQKLYFHRFGTPQSEDVLIMEDKTDPQLFFGGEVTEDGRFLVITVRRGNGVNSMILVKDLRPANSPIIKLIGELQSANSFLGNQGSRFFFKTDNNAPRNRVIAIDLHQPAKLHTIIPEGKDTISNVK